MSQEYLTKYELSREILVQNGIDINSNTGIIFIYHVLYLQRFQVS